MLSFGIKNERETELGFEFDSFVDYNTEYSDMLPQMLAIIINNVSDFIAEHDILEEVYFYFNYFNQTEEEKSENVYN